jgi:LacI family transcriptional regulator
MSATVFDVSRKAGCSPATVSRVINGTGPVSDEVRDRVLRAMSEEGYVPRESMRRIPRRRGLLPSATGADVVEVIFCRQDEVERVTVTDTGVEISPLEVVSEQALISPAYRMANSFYQHILDGALAELGEWKVRAMVRVTNNLMDPDLISDVNADDRRGTILIGKYVDNLSQFVDSCSGSLVIVDCEYHGWPDVVGIDHSDGISRVTRHLIELGHRDIGYLGGDVANHGNISRRNTFVAEMQQAGLAVRPEWISEGTNHVEETTVRAAEMLRRSSRPTALVCFNDFLAVAALKAAGRAGLSVPRDLSVAGFDDIDIAAFTTPSLTTARVPTDEIGRHAARQVLLRSATKGDPRQRRGCEVRVWTELVVRESTAAPPAK